MSERQIVTVETIKAETHNFQVAPDGVLEYDYTVSLLIKPQAQRQQISVPLRITSDGGIERRDESDE